MCVSPTTRKELYKITFIHIEVIIGQLYSLYFSTNFTNYKTNVDILDNLYLNLLDTYWFNELDMCNQYRGKVSVTEGKLSWQL